MTKTILILGTPYKITTKADRSKNKKLDESDGYCDRTSHEIVIPEFDGSDPMSVSNIEWYEKKVIRHELTHAFMFESGIAENSTWGTDETLIDWIAIQFPKMLEAFQKAGGI